MRVRRCAVLFVELDDEPRFDMARLLAGGDGLDRSPRWLAHAPHLDGPVQVTLAQLDVLMRIDRERFCSIDVLAAQHGADPVAALVEAGLLVSEQAGTAAARDAAAREIAWWPQALLAQSGGGWSDIDIQARHRDGLLPSCSRLVEAHGAPPVHEHRVRADGAEHALPPPQRGAFDALLARRATCRNFDPGATLAATDLATMLWRVWGAVGTLELAPGAIAVKKTSPAGGGLHAVEAYVLVQRVEGLAAGLYHYLPARHALEPLRAMQADAAAAAAHRVVAGQHWFVEAPAMVIMAVRFDRLFWKYRRHAKAWRVAHLDVGHLSQTMYLSAADLGLGAFVTAAINDRDVEAMLNLAPLRHGVLAVVGFGPRATTRVTLELDGLVPTPAAERIAD